MLTQLFNPTEIKKNGPATRPAIAPARRSASPLHSSARGAASHQPKLWRCPSHVNGDHHRCTAWQCQRRNSSWMASTLVQALRGVLRELDLETLRSANPTPRYFGGLPALF